MARNNNIFYAGAVFGVFYFPIAALYYLLSGKCLMYESNRLYRALIMLRHGDWYEKRLARTIKLLDIAKGTGVLEIGCGAGKFSKRLLDAGANLKAIDINEQFICKLQKRSKDTFEICSVTDLHYKKGSFDRVVMFDVLHHINGEGYEKALKEIKRVLKKGGYAVIWEGSEGAGEEYLPQKLAHFMIRVLDGDINYFTDIHEYQEKYGLTEIEPHCFIMRK
jgi:ubiquinone/menaquinone biosynthesis C-methylase UbiE